jgi:protein TonB
MKLFFLERESYKAPQWKLSLTISVMIHVLAVALIFFLPQTRKETETPFLTRLISPEELSKIFPPEPSMRRLPGQSSRSRPSQPVPAVPRAAKPAIPRREIPAIPSPSVKPGQREAETGPAQESVARGMRDREAPGQAASPGTPGASAPGGSGAPNTQRGPAIVPSPSIREKLFDREIVEKYAKREEGRRDNSITFDTREFKYEGYMMRLKDRIEGIWHYPADAAMRGIYGDLVIEFTIAKNGRLTDVSLKRTSGHRGLDQAAMQALKDGEPYWPLPDEWGKDSLTVTGHFVYSIYGAHIR